MKPLKTLLCLLFLLSNICYSQIYEKSISPNTFTSFSKTITPIKSLFNTSDFFIENIGQYGETVKSFSQMGKVLYGYEGFGMPALFTLKGIIFLQRKIISPVKKEKEEHEPEEEMKNIKTENKTITMEWIGANPNPEIVTKEKQAAYHTYGLLQGKAYGFKKIIYKEMYPGIDIIYSFNNNTKTGFEYSLLIKQGADVNAVRMRFGRDAKKIKIQQNSLSIISEIDTVLQTQPLSFYTDGTNKKIDVGFKIYGNDVSFKMSDYDKTKEIIVDPFVSSTSNLTGTSAGIAKDIDFDYSGNIYVVGGEGGALPCKLAKFNASGILQWTFNGTLTTPSWVFGPTYGGWVVEKSTGNVFIGQGLGSFGSQIIRLNSSGTYDNYITSADINFSENWKMLWNCNSGTPELLVAGGGTSSNINLGICTPPSTTLSALNLTGIPTAAQDIADIVIDPSTNDMYTIFASGVITPSINSKIYKHTPPYSASTIAWNIFSGFPILNEQKNRPYVTSNFFGNTENSVNFLAVNNSYLFYWDGLNLKAFNKSSGVNAGTSLSLAPNTVLMQGGIVADECNNVYIGNKNGVIKVYKFDGNVFDDAAANDITIQGFPLSSVYDLAYDQGQHLLYACGNGFVASFDIAAYCATAVYSLNITAYCSSLSANATVNPLPPTGSIITYALYNGTTQLQTNTTGVFTGLVAGGSYTIKAFINQACGGTQVIKDFVLSNCPLTISTSFTNATCGFSNGSILAVGANGTPPYQYSIDGINYQSLGLFNNLTAGNYTITIKDANAVVVTSSPIIINNIPGPQLTATAANATCNLNNGIITANSTGGTSPYSYSINGITFQTSNIFTGLSPNNYNVIVKDANNCTSTFAVNISGTPLPSVNANVTGTACSNNTGVINAAASGGTPPYQYSIDGITFQSGNVFSGLPKNTYSLSVKDVSGCIAIASATISLINTLTINTGPDVTICEGLKTQLPATSNGVSFMWSPSTDLDNAALLNPFASPRITTPYTLTAIDGVCTKSSSITVFVNPAPIPDAGKDSSICFGKNLQLNGSGGVSYKWTPATYLSNPSINNPMIVNPNPGSIIYNLSVVDIKGCKSLNDDPVTITVSPPAKLFAGNDTAVAINQPIQLNVTDINNTGFTNYLWSPDYGLNNPNIANPVAILDREITYTIFAKTANGCQGFDNITIKVYKGPDIYVPNAFSPNGDGLNDILKAIPIGMKEFSYFNIYNQFGQLIFSTTNANKGWDGSYKGKLQNIGAYVWIAKATDYKGNVMEKKGSVVLVR